MTLDEFARRVWALLLDASLKSLLLLAVSGLALLFLRRASAAVRHLILLLTLACLLCLPLLSVSLPGWKVPVWPHPAGVTPLRPVSLPAATVPLDAAPISPALPVTAEKSVSLPVTLPAVPTPARSARAPISWPLLGVSLWAVGVCLVLMPVLAGLAAVRRLGRRSSPVTSETLLVLTADLAHQSGIRRPIALRQGAPDDASIVPMTWGWYRPLILLPANAGDWPPDRLRVVLLHELAHIRRRDWSWQMLAHLVCALYWFHPGVWLVARGLRLESERACDDSVLSAGIPASDYARHLVDVARTLSQSGTAPRAAMPMATSQVKERIMAVLQTRKQRSMMTKQAAILTSCVAASILFPLAAMRPAARAGAASAAKADTASPPPTAADRAKANARVSAVGAVPGEADANKLMSEGSHLTPEQDAELQHKLAADPDNLALRIQALGYYSRSAPGVTSENTQRDVQILWLIRTHPDNVLLRGGGTYIFPKTDSAAYAEAKRLWLSYADAHSPKAEILGNGASFLTLDDFPDAERLYQKAEAIEPKNPDWPDRLGRLYQLQESNRHGGLTPDYRTWAQKALAQYQRVPGSSPQDSHNVSLLAAMAKAAYDAGNYPTAQACAQRLLQLPDLDKQSAGMTFFDEDSDAIHQGNMILGRLALREGDKASAEAHLLAMGRVSGSPVLDSFGPNMQLAQDLLEQGDRAVVLQYFEECAKFWKNDFGHLAQWRTAVQRGQMPNFDGNLSY